MIYDREELAWLGETKRQQIAAALSNANTGYGRNMLVEVAS